MEDLTDLEGIVEDLLELDEVWLAGTDGVIASQVRTASLRALIW